VTKKDELFVPLPSGRDTKSNFLEHQQILKALAAKHTVRHAPGEPLSFIKTRPEVPKEEIQALYDRIRSGAVVPPEVLDPSSPDLTPEQKESILHRARNDPKFFLGLITSPPALSGVTINPHMDAILHNADVFGSDRLPALVTPRQLGNRRLPPIKDLIDGRLAEIIKRNLEGRAAMARAILGTVLPDPKPRDKIRARRRIKRRGRKN